MEDCLFCKIISGDVPSNKVYEDELVYAFRDIEPQAPVHILIIPKEHIKSLVEVEKSHQDLLGHILLVASKLAKEEGLDNGYRTVMNIGKEGLQSVDHLHLHLLGGRTMQWPPG